MQVWRSACPIMPTGKHYLGIHVAAGTLGAWSYLDEALGALAGSVDVSALDDFYGRVYFDGEDTFVFEAAVLATGRAALVTWTVGGALQVNEFRTGFTPYAWGVIGSDIYAYENLPGTVYPFHTTVGASGTNGGGIDNLLGTDGGGDPIGVDLVDIGTDVLPSAALALIAGVPYLDWWQGASVEPTFYDWPPSPASAIIQAWGVGAEIGTGTQNVLPILGYGGVRLDPAGDRCLIFNSANAFRVAGLPVDWIADMGELRPAPNGDLFAYVSGAMYARIQSAYLSAGVTVADSCVLPTLTFDNLPGGFTPDVFPLD